MKTLELNTYGVQPLSQSEMSEINGGILPLVVLGAVILLASCGQCSEDAAGPCPSDDPC